MGFFNPRIVPTSFSFYFILFFSFIFISWRLITLQYCSGFCHTLTWISHGVTCIPHPDPLSHLPLHPIPLGLPSAPGPSTYLMHPAWAGDQHRNMYIIYGTHIFCIGRRFLCHWATREESFGDTQIFWKAWSKERKTREVLNDKLGTFFLFFLFCKNNFYWNIVALQCYISFCCIAVWISYTYVPLFMDFLPI